MARQQQAQQTTLHQELEARLIQSIAKKSGVSEADAKATVAAVKRKQGPDKFDDWLNKLERTAPMIARLPPSLQASAVSMMTSNQFAGGNGSDGESDETKKMIKDIAMVKTVLGSLSDDQKKADPETTKMFEKMSLEMQGLRDDKQKREFSDQITAVEKRITDRVVQEIATIAPKVSADGEDGEDKRSSIKKTVEELKRLNAEKQELLESLGLQDIAKMAQSTQSAKPSPEEVAALAKEYGFEVKRPESAAEVRKWAEQRFVEVQKETREQTLKETKNREKTITMITDFALGAVQGILPLFTQAGESKGLEIAQKMLETGAAVLKPGMG